MSQGVVASLTEPRYVAAGGGSGKPVHLPSAVDHQGTGVGQQTGIPMICQTGSMDQARAAEVLAESAAVLRKTGARFAYLQAVAPLGSTVRIRTLTSRRTSAASRRTRSIS